MSAMKVLLVVRTRPECSGAAKFEEKQMRMSCFDKATTCRRYKHSDAATPKIAYEHIRLLLVVGMAVLAFTSLPVSAAAMKLADIIKGFDDSDTTTVRDSNSETTGDINLGFTISPGGALVLCEPDKGTAGPALPTNKGGKCDDNNPSSDNTNGSEKSGGSISDILGFPVGKKVLTFYSDSSDASGGLNALKTAAGGALDAGSLSKFFDTDATSGYISYLPEGTFFDERAANAGGLGSGKITDHAGVSVYIRSARNFDRAFVLYSDTTGSEVPEPPALLLLATVALVAWSVSRDRPLKNREH